jgi:hypothetical protein
LTPRDHPCRFTRRRQERAGNDVDHPPIRGGGQGLGTVRGCRDRRGEYRPETV